MHGAIVVLVFLEQAHRYLDSHKCAASRDIACGRQASMYIQGARLVMLVRNLPMHLGSSGSARAAGNIGYAKCTSWATRMI